MVTNKKRKRNNQVGYDLVDIPELNVTETATDDSKGVGNVDSDLPPEISDSTVIGDINVLLDQGGNEGSTPTTNNTPTKTQQKSLTTV